ncbi:S-adenosylmethionine decarboxylase proenzyme isoform X2 [Nematostella vectensis]|uniref:S-adenosylmethionine decarboxylase proenzyme isoform X2 n=1 Tax=Nematostella vectensis TaxID=45351 RepID=UPI0020771E1B|nr:S-adenosylmethionine decarboxylase proenzyme isoform X2 [Nematostella vectensis]
MCEVGFFEGPEKLLEIWWRPTLATESILRNRGKCNNMAKKGDLREIPRQKWEKILQLVNCQIISEKRNEDMISYLLSESSMFISKERIILKTCGTTTLLYSIKPLLNLAAEECGLTIVQDLFYSRMNYLKPDMQKDLHRSFEKEVQWLDKLFANGAAYSLGRVNGDSWYFYTLRQQGVEQPDQTLEILMQDLDPNVMKAFYTGQYANVSEVTKATGIADFIPGAIIDDFLFDPCGYSMNGLFGVSSFENNNITMPDWYPDMSDVGDNYFTIHITPQKECSYVSFETNIRVKCYKELVNKVLKAFKPGRFLMTLFANEGAPCGPSLKTFQELGFHGYQRWDLQLCQMKYYNLTYGHYRQVSSKGSSEVVHNGHH